VTYKVEDDSKVPNGVVGGSIPGCEIFSLLDGKTSQVTKHIQWSFLLKKKGKIK
jgi:hypothetical protein